ncbi:hypothetical protein NUM_40910 [Actinocatenispora comari]|jgi:hypothetical protein|uniref:Uncharacterized protein n=1 Tax=Actinocatenispora comari TaxID=2807577 RepID=A0A8J4EL25_9ACTN|nr:hypothetical protein NUM_40910 [Actinocatenispora comari]
MSQPSGSEPATPPNDEATPVAGATPDEPSEDTDDDYGPV